MACGSPIRLLSSLAMDAFNNNNNESPSGFPGGVMSEVVRYTVEQLMLIRRLHQTGITVQEIIHAFNDIDAVVAYLDTSANFFSPPPTASVSLPAADPSSTRPSPVLVLPTTPSLPGPSLVQAVQLQAPVATVPSIETTLASLMPQHSNMFLALQQSSNAQSMGVPSSSVLHNSIAAAIAAAQAAATAAAQQQQAAHQLKLEQDCTTPPSASAVGSASTSGEQHRPRSQRTPMREITTLDNPRELEEFMSSGEETCIQDMKTFITHYSLRQTTVAMMTGVSQPYISKLLNGNHRELSLRCRKNIYCWYLNCRRHPEKLSSFLADPSSRLETNGDGELVPQKRERYVFRPVLLRLLEQFFTETPFPDTQRRIEIATSCNAALQNDKKGVGLMPKEVVSPQVVSNWFANKRKELRRKNDPRYQDPLGLHPAIIEALERGSSSVPERSDTGSASPNDEDTMDGLEQLQQLQQHMQRQQQQAAAEAAAATVSQDTVPQATVPRTTPFPPPDFSIFERLGLAAPSALFHAVKGE